MPARRSAGGAAGDYDPLLGASYAQLAREGLGFQKSQNGGPSAPQAGRQSSAYHRFESRVTSGEKELTFFDGIDVSLAGIASLAGAEDAAFLKQSLASINGAVESALTQFNGRNPGAIAPHLARGLRETNDLVGAVRASKLSAAAKYDILHELTIKSAQFNHALAAALGLSVSAGVTAAGGSGDPAMAMFRGQPDTFRVAIPGQQFAARLHIANQSGTPVKVVRAYLEAAGGEAWRISAKNPPGADLTGVADVNFDVKVPSDARLTQPYFTRPHLGFPYYDKIDEGYLNSPLAPYPLAGWAEIEYQNATLRIGQIVQTTQRVTGLGAVSEPLTVGPAISVSVQPRSGIVPLGAKSFPLTALVLSNVKGPARGSVRIECPAGWKSNPATAEFSIPGDGAAESLHFDVTPSNLGGSRYECSAIAEYDGRRYSEGYQITGYPGLRPYFLYLASTHSTSGVDVKVAPDLKIGYVTGTGDEVPEALGNLGIKPSFLSSGDLAGADLSRYDAILLGVRAYAVREDLKANNARLLAYVKNGGVAIVQYNTPEFDHNYGPYPYTMGNNPEEVTDETSQIEILDPANPIFTTPNRITQADFDNWIEERGSKFMRSWDAGYSALLSTHDPGQEPQKGGLLFARYGKGVYVYNAYAFYRQLPEGVPGAYRLLANMLSLGRKR